MCILSLFETNIAKNFLRGRKFFHSDGIHVITFLNDILKGNIFFTYASFFVCIVYSSRTV